MPSLWAGLGPDIDRYNNYGSYRPTVTGEGIAMVLHDSAISHSR